MTENIFYWTSENKTVYLAHHAHFHGESCREAVDAYLGGGRVGGGLGVVGVVGSGDRVGSELEQTVECSATTQITPKMF